MLFADMDLLWFLAFVGGVLGLVIVMGAIAIYQDHRRHQGLVAWSESMGFEYLGKLPEEWLSNLRGFEISQRGSRPRGHHVVRGNTNDVEVWIFDFQYTTTSTSEGKSSSQTHTITLLVIHSPHLNLPKFLLRPETFFDRMGLTFDGKDINFEDRPLFSKLFHLHGPVEDQIRKSFTPEVLDYLEEHKHIYVEGNGNRLLYSHPGESRVAVSKMQTFLAEGFAFYSLFKKDSN